MFNTDLAAQYSQHSSILGLYKLASSNQTSGWVLVYLWNHVLEGLHDLGALSLLIIGEDACDDDDGCQHDAQVQLLHYSSVSEDKQAVQANK